MFAKQQTTPTTRLIVGVVLGCLPVRGEFLISVRSSEACPLAMSLSRRVKIHIYNMYMGIQQLVPTMHPLYRGCPYLRESVMEGSTVHLDG